MHFFFIRHLRVCVILGREIGFHTGSLLYGVKGSSFLLANKSFQNACYLSVLRDATILDDELVPCPGSDTEYLSSNGGTIDFPSGSSNYPDNCQASWSIQVAEDRVRIALLPTCQNSCQ